MSEGALRTLKAVLGGVVLLLLVFTVVRWYGDFRISTTNDVLEAVEETATPPQGEGGEATEPGGDAGEAGTEPSEAGSPESQPTKTVVVLTDGLNFRKQPKKDADVIRGLDKGEKLALLEESAGWYRVRDKQDIEGWITASPSYSEVQ